MSRKKNDGALSGSASANSRCRLPSISTTVTSNARPRPSDSMTLGVSAPGRWMLAMASRKTVERWRGTCRAIHIVTMRDQPQQQKDDGGGDDEVHRHAAVISRRDCQRRKKRNDRRRRDRITRPRPAALRCDLVAEQPRYGNVVGAPERPQRKGKRGEEAIDNGQRQHVRMQRRRNRQRNDRPEGRHYGKRQSGAQRGAEQTWRSAQPRRSRRNRR